MFSDDRVKTDFMDDVLRELESLRQRFAEEANLLRYHLHEKAQVENDIRALQDKRERWMCEKKELEEQLAHMETLVNRHKGIKIDLQIVVHPRISTFEKISPELSKSTLYGYVMLTKGTIANRWLLL